VQSDLYCTGGEAFIRNMLIGAAVAREFNALQNVVYLPDTFGHVPCMPMLVRGFGYDTYVFMRGLPPSFPSRLRFFRWRAPDGSWVQVFRLRDGYGNAARLGVLPGGGPAAAAGAAPRFSMDKAVERFEAAMAKQVDRQGPPYVLIAGVDHQIPQPQLPSIMRNCSRQHRHFRFSDWDDVATAMRRRTGRWRTYRGECHGSGASSILGGTVSTRVYLKQANADAERMLVQVAEPADAVAKLLGYDHPAYGSLHAAWKRLLRAHPHDDMTGCSVDAVHRENEMHIVCASQAADAVRRRMAHHLIEHFGGQVQGDGRYAFFVFAAQAGKDVRRVVVKADYEGRHTWGDTRPSRCYSIVDDEGRAVPFRELSRGRSVEHPHPVVNLELRPRARPFTFRRFFIEPRPRWLRATVGSELENNRLHVSIRPNGTIDVRDKHTKRTWSGLGVFSDQADCGDEYTFSHIRGDPEEVFNRLRAKRTRAFGCNRLQVAGRRVALRIPVRSSPQGRSRVRVALPMEIEYSLAPGEPLVVCRLRFTNTARDHRLRWNLPLPGTPAETRAGLKFAEVRRSSGRRVRTKRGFVIDPEHPADQFVAVERGRAGLAIFPRFPLNYEVVRGSRPRLALALLRAVGFLSRSDMLTRGGGAGPGTRTPEAQCLRSFEMVFAIRPFECATEGAGLLAEAARWRSEPVTGLITGYQSDVQPVTQDPVVEVRGRNVVVSSMKRSGDGGEVALRLFNAGPRSLRASVRVQSVRVAELRLLDERTKVRVVRADRNGWLSVPMRPYSLATLVVRPAGRSRI
jgi:hypothetical protein